MSLTPKQYQEAKELFLTALEKPAEERLEHIRRVYPKDDIIRREVESLLMTREKPEENLASLSPLVIASTTLNPTLRLPAILRLHLTKLRVILLSWIAAFTLLVGVSVWLFEDLRRSFEQEIGEQLRVVSLSQMESVRLWTELGFSDLEKWTGDPELRNLVEQLERKNHSGMSREELLALPEHKQVTQKLTSLLEHSRFMHFGLIDKTPTVLAADETIAIGRPIKGEWQLAVGLKRVEGGERGFRAKRRFMSGVDMGPNPFPKKELNSVFVVPIKSMSGEVIATLTGHLDFKNFNSLLNKSQWGLTGETYAFGTSGEMLSGSRFRSNDISLLATELRDPNINSSDEPDTHPFTKPVALALAAYRDNLPSPHGTILNPYSDYRGVNVLGAWVFDPKLEIGIIAEIDAAEVYARLAKLERILWLIIVVAFLLFFGFAYSNLSLFHLRPQARLGSRLGQYKLIRKIGEGGSGNVFLASHQLLKRPTAIKILKPERYDMESVKRFEIEVKATSRLSHPSTISIYDFGRSSDGSFYYAMEYLVGIHLSKLCEVEGAIPQSRAIHILLQISESLRESHQAGLVHRDIKPLNIMICRIGGEFDRVKVMDFGLVKNLRQSSTTDSTDSAIQGTPLYMAPECFQSPSDCDERVDIYSFGSLAYRMLGGRNLFDVSSDSTLIFDIVRTKPKMLEDLGIILHSELDRLIMGCLEKDPKARPQSMDEIHKILANLQIADPWTDEQAKSWWAKRDYLLPSLPLV